MPVEERIERVVFECANNNVRLVFSYLTQEGVSIVLIALRSPLILKRWILQRVNCLSKERCRCTVLSKRYPLDLAVCINIALEGHYQLIAQLRTKYVESNPESCAMSEPIKILRPWAAYSST